MMKFMFYLVFMIPLCFKNYWLIQYFMFFLIFIFMLNFNCSMMTNNISYFYGIDMYSYFFILLSLWISSLMILASFKVFKSNNYYIMFLLMIILLLISLINVFSSLNLFIFYLFFEISLIPLLIIIIGWGYQPERLMAGMYMFFYTIFFSFPMMVGLFLLYKSFFSFMIFEYLVIEKFMIYFLVNMVFFVKIPLFVIHLWLPKAHVEAPVSGSMILAGVMLKLGGYGLMRFMKLFIFYYSSLNMFFIVLSMIGGLMISVMCLIQTDMKMLIAYSSVSHMGLVLSSILSLSLIGFTGSLVMMLAHGLCSSGLFCIVNIYYERFNSRSLYLIKGLINVFPNFSFFMFMLCICNMAAPPSLNLMGEILMMKSLVSFSLMNMIFLSLTSFFCAVYCIFLYSYVNHGILSSNLYSLYTGLNREYLLLFLHLLPLNMLVLFGYIFMI